MEYGGLTPFSTAQVQVLVVEGAARGRRTPFVGVSTDAAMDYRNLNLRGRERRQAAVLLCECQGTRVRMENSSSRKRWVSRQRGRPRQAPNTVGDRAHWESLMRPPSLPKIVSR